MCKQCKCELVHNGQKIIGTHKITLFMNFFDTSTDQNAGSDWRRRRTYLLDDLTT